MGGKTVETGAAVLDRPRDVVRQAAGRLAQQIEREHRAWLAGEFGSDLTGRAEIDGLLAAMPDIAVSVLSDLPAMIEADLDPAAFVAPAVARVGRSDERFRPDTTGARLLRCLLLNVYTAARAETEFAKAMTIAVQQALLERATRLEAGQQRIAATLAAGAERLHLLARHHRKAAPVSLRQLLMAELPATDLVGREEELQPLQMWLAVKGDRSDISVHCLTGQGGAGKTRLAIELCEWAERAGWSAGFVHHDELARFHDHHHPSDWQWDRTTLVVVDYAAASARTLRAWLEALAPATRVRRRTRCGSCCWSATPTAKPAGGPTWSTQPPSGPGPDTLIEPQAPVRLGPLRAEADRRALLTQAMQLAAPLLSRPPPPLPPPGADPQFDRQLHDNRIETEPLFLVMAGIVAVEKGAPAALALGRLDLAGDVASADAPPATPGPWAGADKSLVLHLAACVTLQGGCAPETAIGLIEQERAALGDCTSVRSDQLETLLRDALPPPEGDGVDAVRPDLIGEAFLLNELCPASRRIEAVERAFGRAARR